MAYKVRSCIPAKRGYYTVGFSHAKGDELEFSIHEELVVEYRLVVDKTLDEATFDQLQKDLGYGSAYAYAIAVLSRRMYTQKEIREKLLTREVEVDVIEEVIKKLLELDLLDDSRYAKIYIETQIEAAKKSKERILMDLRQKGVSRHIVEDCDALFSSDQELAVVDQEIEKAWRRLVKKELTDYERKHKIVQSVARKGFDLDDIFSRYEIFIDER